MLHIILRHPDYAITEKGDIYNEKTKRYLKASASNTGYLTVYVDGKNRLLHRLLAQTFIPNPDDLPCVNHKDGNKLNNDISNLEWCTYGENERHAYKTGLKKCRFMGGENSANHKLTEADVKFIRDNYKRYDKLYGAKPLSIKFNVTPSCITNIVYGANWRCI